MGMISASEYVKSIRNSKAKVYYAGKQISNLVEHPVTKPAVNVVAATYALAEDPKWHDIMIAKGEDGQNCNVCCSLMKSPKDLVKKYKTVRAVATETGRGNVRTVGLDAINSVGSIVYEIDKEIGTEYSDRFLAWLKNVQERDQAISGAITDAKGVRTLRPKEQPDPDHYVHVIEERKDGIVVKGAKVHQTMAPTSHWHLVAPTTAMREQDAEYAIVFAVPSDAEGVIHFYGRQMGDARKTEGCEMDLGNVHYGSCESLIIFENVFVPWEHVFLYKEWQFTRRVVERFANYHRQGYGASRAAMADVLIGAVYSLAKMYGLADRTIIKEKLTEMIHLGETMYACGLAASYEGHATPSGIYVVDEILVNASKLNVTRFPYEIARLAQDIAGGIYATCPHEKDFKDPKMGKYIEKYLKTDPNIPTEHRIRLVRLVENLCFGTGSTYFLAESMHGAGSPEAMKLRIRDFANFEKKAGEARRLCGIDDNPLTKKWL